MMDTGGERRHGGGRRFEISVVEDNEAVWMHGAVTVNYSGTSALNYCHTSHSKPTTVIFHTHRDIS